MDDRFVHDWAALVVTGVRQHWPQKAGHPGWDAQHPTPSLDAVAKRTGYPVKGERKARSAARYRQALGAPESVRRLIDQELDERIPEFDTIARLALFGLVASSNGEDAKLAKAAASSRYAVGDLVLAGVQAKGAATQLEARLEARLDTLWGKWRGDGRG
jgi:hypothetical protein